MEKVRRRKTSKTAADGDGTMTAQNTGLALIVVVFLLYSFGFLESIRALPEINSKMMWDERASPVDNIYVARDGLLATTSTTTTDGIVNSETHDKRATERMPKLRGGSKRRQMPAALWPVTTRGEKFVSIEHPGDPSVTMNVPSFWSPPIHYGRLMTKDLAMQVGSCVSKKGDKCGPDDRTIFVAIASYRDWQCRHTVESIFLRARYPQRVRVGVVDQIVADEDVKCNDPIVSCDEDSTQALCLYKDQVDVYEMEAPMAVGPVFARHIGHRLYRGEYYAMQSDAHVTFTTDWDTDIIAQHESTTNDMAVLTTYLTDVVGSIDNEGKSLRNTRPIMCNTDYEGGAQGQHLRHLSQPEGVPTIKGTPQLEPYWAAGFSFSRGHFVVNVPYDLYQPMIFQGEEMSIGIRGFTIGYDYYAPERSVCFHHYAEGPNKKLRNKVKHFWENADHYQGTGIKAMSRLLGIVGMNPDVDPATWNHAELDRYGIGNVRTTQKFYDTFGIDVVQQKTEHHLCQFVDSGIMHRQFLLHLRKDGMGIDYGLIKYQFTDPQK